MANSAIWIALAVAIVFTIVPVSSAAERTHCKGTTNFVGLRNVEVTLKEGDTVLETRTANHWTWFRLAVDKQYKVTVSHKGATETRDFACKGDRKRDFTEHGYRCTATIRFPGVWGDVQIEKNGVVQEFNRRGGYLGLHMQRQTGYGLKIRYHGSQGAWDVDTTFDCDKNRVQVKGLTNIGRFYWPGVWADQVDIFREGETDAVLSRKNVGGGWGLWMFKGNYKVKVAKGGVTQERDATCQNGCIVRDFARVMRIYWVGVRNVDATLKDSTGAVHATVTGRYHGWARWVLKGSYTVDLADKTGISHTRNLDCTNAGKCFDNTVSKRMYIYFGGVYGVSVKVSNQISGKTVHEYPSRNGAVSFWALKHPKYNVTVCHPDARTCIEKRDIEVGEAGNLVRVTGFTNLVGVYFIGVYDVHVKVYNAETGALVRERAHVNGGYRFWSLRQNLRVVISKAGVEIVQNNIDCKTPTNLCKLPNQSSVVRARFPGVYGVSVKAETTAPTSSAPGTVVREHASRNGAYHFWVLKGHYKLTMCKLDNCKVIEDLDCDDGDNYCAAHEAVTGIMRVWFNGIRAAKVTIKVLPEEAGQEDNGALYREYANRNGAVGLWVWRMAYRVTVEKDAMKVSRNLDCQEMGAHNDCRLLRDQFVTRFFMRYYGVTHLDVKVKHNGVTVHQGRNRHHVYYFWLLHGTYDVEATQGPRDLAHSGMVYSFNDVAALGANAYLNSFTGYAKLYFRGERRLIEFKTPGGLDVYKTTRWHYLHKVMVCGDYKLFYDGVDQGTITVPCNGQSVKVDPPTPMLPVKKAVPDPIDCKTITFTGGDDVADLEITCKSEHGSQFTDEESPMKLDQQTVAGDWSCNVTQAAAETTIAFTTAQDADHTQDVSGLFTTLTVSVGANLNVSVEITSGDDSDEMAEKANIDGDVTFKLLKGTYDVHIEDDAQELIIADVDCTGATCAVASTAVACDVTIQHGKANITSIQVGHDDEDFDIDVAEDGDSKVTLLQAQYTYDMESNAAQRSGAIDCRNQQTLTVSSTTSQLTVNHADVDDMDMDIDIDDAFVAEYRDQDGPSTVVDLLAYNGYDVKSSIDGAKTVANDVDCSGDCTVEAATVLTANFDGLDNIRVTVRAAAAATGDGSIVAQVGGNDDSVAISTLRGTYNVNLIDEDAEHSANVDISNVDCTGATCSVAASAVVAKVTTVATGLTDFDVELQNSDDETLAETDEKDNTAELKVLKQTGVKANVEWKDLVSSFSGIDASSDVSVTVFCTVEVKFDGRSGVDVDVKVGDKTVDAVEDKENTATFNLLAGQDYSIVLGGDGFPLGEERSVSACSGAMTSNAPMDAELAFLKDLYDNCNGASWTVGNWASHFNDVRVCSGEDTTDMSGIVCRTSVVKEINLDWNNLVCESLPASINKMEFLQVLSLEGNEVKGLPESFGELENIKVLNMAYNKMAGSIGAFLGNFGNSLQVLKLNGNSLTGGIPASFKNLVFLKTLHLQFNELTGGLFNMVNMTELQDCKIDHNKLSGALPDVFDKLINLEVFWCQNNTFTGVVPPTLSEASNLKHMDVRNNKLGGPLPDLSMLTELNAIETEDNNLSEEASCEEDEDGVKVCTKTEKATSDEDSAAGSVHAAGMIQLVFTALAAVAIVIVMT